MGWSRRTLLLAGGALAVGARSGAVRAATDDDGDVVGRPLRPWRPGMLDIHHISTGRGDSTLIIGPDGSSIMIDAGASLTPSPPALATRPDEGRRPGEWIGRYAQRRLRDVGATELDVFLATHQHPDHVGDVDESTPLAPGGGYRLSGVTDVDAITPIRRLIDRAYPSYDLPRPVSLPFQANYEAFVRARLVGGRSVERFTAGTLNQLRRDQDASTVPGYSIRNLAVNGQVWTGRDETSRSRFPDMATLSPADIPEENLWSAALRVSYGAFGYFAAGDLTSATYDGALPWRDVETAAARVCGRVDVAVTPHHGMFDATGADAARALQPRIWIVSAWHALHPSPSTLDRVFNPRLYSGPRDVFATALDETTDLAMPWLTGRLASRNGHVVVRVAPGGATYDIVVTSNHDESDRVIRVLGSLPAGNEGGISTGPSKNGPSPSRS
ncbi:MBL fold metallo-hydrolase [uncultured Brevundimonas sp.]|uniref:ComEC/Rec2 family competence protein n=1 Tax=uncultured Brevundimonas sp. TaxID=213418 RepID=UPI00261C77BB|nr:MBL fold metallo-hydrolase [uncultured Brevundimonas sp.]